MKLATWKNGAPEFGFVRADGRLVGFADAAAAADLDFGADGLLDLIERWGKLGDSSGALGAAVEGDRVRTIDPSGITWLAPVPRSADVFGVAANNRTVADSASFIADHPVFFSEPSSALNGHESPIVIQPRYGLTHTEAELGVVIGRRAKEVGVDEAMDYVFGYTIVNDVTSPDLKSADTIVFDGAANLTDKQEDVPGFEHGDMVLTYHARSKGTDGFLPCGPYLTTKEEIADPQALAVRAYLDGQLVTEDNTARLRFTVAEVISHVSNHCTLQPGDLVHMGTAATGSKYKLRDLDFQQWNGPAEIEIDGLGRLVNPIERRSGR